MKLRLVVGSLGIVIGLGLFATYLRPFTMGETTAVIDTNKRQPNDKRQYRALTLDNQLTVLLISDPNVNKSAAAMDVGVGSLEDPSDHLGLAHFLEHMLFLGTSKYPDVEEYNRYLHAHQGGSNAYTAAENTNYHFEIDHNGFEGALDRFAQFFVAPLFNPEYVERERQAVNSEHQKNLNDDFWRSRMLQRSLHKPGHPRQKFSTGDLTTLKGVNREILVDFYKKYYSSNVMKLALLSTASLDQQEAWVRQMFAAVPNHNRDKLQYDAEIFAADSLPRVVQIKPIKNVKKLELQFAAPSADAFWKSKPGSTLSHLIGHEGQGSLLAFLKKAGLASGLAAWIDSSTYASTFHFDITLTEQGLAQRDAVIEHFFAYINLLRAEGYKRYIYDERKIMGDINFVYRDLREGTDVVAAYAARMQVFPPLEVDRNDSLLHEYNPDDFNLFLSYITPAKMSVFFSAPSVTTDTKEPYYGTDYSIQKIDASALKRWENASANPQLSLPIVNEFIPRQLTLLTSKQPTTPERLIENEWGTFWFQQDDTFQLPKANVQLLLLNKQTNTDAKAKTLSLLYTMALSEGLNEWNYDIGLAGLHYSVARVERGIQLDFSGYAENLPALMESVATKLTNITIDAKRFEVLKEELKRNVANTRLDVAYQQLLYELKYLSARNIIHKDEIYEPTPGGRDLITPVTLDELKQYAKTLYKEIAIEGAAYGNLDAGELKDAVSSYYKTLAKAALPPSSRPQPENLQLPKGKPLAKVMSSDDNNHCWGSNIQFGKRDPRLNAAIRVGHAHLKTSFFGQLRTEQQLGYIVYSGLNHQEKALGLLLLVQSSEYPPFEISRRVRQWKDNALDELAAMKDEELAAYKRSVATELRQRDKTIADRHQTVVFEAITMEGQFNYKERIAKEVEALSKADLIAIFTEAFKDETAASFSVYLSNTKSGAEKPTETLVTDDQQFKTTTPVF